MTLPDWLYPVLSLDFIGVVIGTLGLLLAGGMVWWARGLLRWIACGITVLFAVLTIAGTSHLVQLAGINATHPAPGSMVDIGGYKVHLLAEGPASNITLVWFGGGHSSGLTMYRFHRDLRGEARSVLIDRPGTGWSDTGPFPRTTALEAEEMIRALEVAGEEGPFLLIGHSFGGLLAANMARRYPDKTAGVVLLDATPTDIVFYGLDQSGLSSLAPAQRRQGLLKAFGLYRGTRPPLPPFMAEPLNDEPNASLANPYTTNATLAARAGHSFATASIFEELSSDGLAGRGWETSVFAGDLGALPVYLVAPGADASTAQYASMVASDEVEAERFARFLANTREQYLRISSRAVRIYAPEGTGHNFIYEDPEFLISTLRSILDELSTPPES